MTKFVQFGDWWRVAVTNCRTSVPTTVSVMPGHAEKKGFGRRGREDMKGFSTPELQRWKEKGDREDAKEQEQLACLPTCLARFPPSSST